MSPKFPWIEPGGVGSTETHFLRGGLGYVSVGISTVYLYLCYANQVYSDLGLARTISRYS